MATLNANTVVRRGFESVVLYAGDEVPEWAADQVGEHLLSAPAAEVAAEEVVTDTGATDPTPTRRR